MRVLFIGRGVDHASTRVRLLQYRAPLAKLGVHVQVIEWEPRSRSDILALSISAIGAARRADVVLILKPRIHPWAFDCIRAVNPRIAVDIDDAMWTWGDVFADRFDHAARRARGISVGSTYLATATAARYPEATTTRIPTAVELADYPMRPAHETNGPAVVGWIGNTSSLTDFSEPVVRALRDHIEANRIRLRIVSSHPLGWPGLREEFESWSLATQVDSIRRFDIGIMPLHDDEQARGRCGLKAIQCMAAGVPVVSSPIGAATEIIDGTTNGLLATTQGEWFEAIARLSTDVAERATFGERARARVEQEFSVTANTPKLLAMLASIAT